MNKKRPALRAVVLSILVVLALCIRPAAAHVRAASLLLRFADEHASGGIVDVDRHLVDEEQASLDTAFGPTRARIYIPRDAPGAPGLVLVHGVHRLGIDEPRLIRFSRAIASSGVVVLTPEVKEIADYRVDPRSIDTIGAAAALLDHRLGTGKAGVMGMSFAGGLALLAAADPRFSDSIGFVVAVGAHHDLARVSRFFATNQVERPDGSSSHLEAHGYGALVMIYGHAEHFFAAEDVPAARDAIRLWLWDDRDAARARAESLSPEGWAKMDVLMNGQVDLVAPEILREIDMDREGMTTVSPHGHLARMSVPVFLLHGEGDNVIPAAETEWIAREVPPSVLRSELVSPAIVHVEMGHDAKVSDQWALVHFMAGILEEADASRG